MSAQDILILFILLKLGQHLIERSLARVNQSYYSDADRQTEAQQILGISDEDMKKTQTYSNDKFRFGTVTGWIRFGVFVVFLAAGGLGFFEEWARALAGGIGAGSVVQGLFFFGLLGISGIIFGIPFEAYRTFVIEERHGFNRQTVKGFFGDQLKGLLLGLVLGGLVLTLVLWIMEAAGYYWWVFAWLVVSGFSLLTAWIYPTLLAPLFNKFTPVEEGELKDKIEALAKEIGFETNGIYVMDASKRSSHGNAYFTGVGNKKRIVLFDTLLEAMSVDEVVAVLAHELGHFKLHHVRWALIRSVVMTGLVFYLLSLTLPLERFYEAFYLDGISNYGALVVFGLWFGLVDFALQPFENYLSRRNEFAADSFALRYIPDVHRLGHALLKLREKSHAMPVSHPMFSRMYHSHPPMLERLKAMGFGEKEARTSPAGA